MSSSVTKIYFRQVRPFLLSAASSGVDVDRILPFVGLKQGLEQVPPETELKLVDYYRLQRHVAQALDDLTAQLSERKLTYKTGNFVISQLSQSQSLKDAIASLAEYFNMMHGESYNSVRVSRDAVSLVVDDSAFPYRCRQDEELTRFVGDCLLIKLHCLLDSLSNGQAVRALRRVRLLRKRGAGDDPQNRYWHVPVEYGRQVYELVYDHEQACHPIRKPEEVDLSYGGIFNRVISHLERDAEAMEPRSFVARTCEIISEDCIRQPDVAERLGISVATLRRRLSEENVSFRDLVQQSRLGQAETLLMRGRSVAQVCEQLNYSDVRAFNRAFKKSKGVTPAAFSRQATAAVETSA